MTHFPRETRGCYYHRVEDCCWLCRIKMVAAYLRMWWRFERER